MLRSDTAHSSGEEGAAKICRRFGIDGSEQVEQEDAPGGRALQSLVSDLELQSCGYIPAGFQLVDDRGSRLVRGQTEQDARRLLQAKSLEPVATNARTDQIRKRYRPVPAQHDVNI